MSDTNPTDPTVTPVDEAPPVVSPPVDAPLTPPPVDPVPVGPDEVAYMSLADLKNVGSVTADEPPTPSPEPADEPQHPNIASFESMSVTDFVAWVKGWVNWKLGQ